MIFLDVDGVLADFVSGAIEACDLPITEAEVRTWNFFSTDLPASQAITEEVFWDRIRSYHEFWLGLAAYPWASALVNTFNPADVRFVTSCGGDPSAATQKIEWLIRQGFLKDHRDDRYILTSHKHLLAGKGMLIDDSAANWRRFRNAGGDALLFPNRWNLSPGANRDTAIWDFINTVPTTWEIPGL